MEISTSAGGSWNGYSVSDFKSDISSLTLFVKEDFHSAVEKSH